MTGRDWETLGKEVRRRRALLHLRQADLEARGGPGAGTIRNIEQASRSSYATRTFVQLETALQWGDGVVEKILDGTATRSEIDEVVVRGQLGAQLPGPVVYLKSGGAGGTAAGDGEGQVIRPESIESQSRVGKPTVTVDDPLAPLRFGPGERIPQQNPTVVTVAELIGRLGKQKHRTPAADDALKALHRLLPELWGEEYTDPDDT